VDHEPRSRVRPKKGARDRLIRLLVGHPDWALGFQDETWWSRLSLPELFAWADGKPLRLIEQSLPKDDLDPKALACYGILLRLVQLDSSIREEVWLRFVDGRPISSVTTQFLDWVCHRLESRGKQALLMPWDNASWHVSREVKTWIREHNRQVKREGKGVRVIPCYLPIKSPWLNPIEPRWVHAKRKVVEPDRLLSAAELADRVCAVFGCAHEVHLAIPVVPESIPEKVA
jgi:transposase